MDAPRRDRSITPPGRASRWHPACPQGLLVRIVYEDIITFTNPPKQSPFSYENDFCVPTMMEEDLNSYGQALIKCRKPNHNFTHQTNAKPAVLSINRLPSPQCWTITD